MKNFYLNYLLFFAFFLLSIKPYSQTIIQEINRLSATDRAVADQLGYKVAMSGDFAIVAAPFQDYNINGENFMENSGAVYIFKRDENNQWQQHQKIIPNDREPQKLFGSSIDIYENTIIVGCPTETELSAPSAYVFELSENENWIQTQKLTVSVSSNSNTKFGYDVAVQNDKILIGAPQEDKDENEENPLASSGAVYYFQKDISGIWQETQKLVPQDRSFGDAFGRALSVDSNKAIITAPFDSNGINGTNYTELGGSAYIFSYNDQTENWIENQKIIAEDRNEIDYFGWSCDIFNDEVIIGSLNEDHDLNGENSLQDAGASYIFKLDENEIWYQSQKIIAPERNTLDRLGYSVGINSNFVIIGAFSEDEDENEQNTINSSGSAYVYKKNSQGDWQMIQKIVATDRDLGDYYGYSVDADGDYFISGAINQDQDSNNENSLDNSGMAYILKKIELPTVICQDITVYLNEDGNISISAEDINNGSYSIESDINLDINISEFNCSDIGENEVILTISDMYNSVYCNSVVTVIDNSDPTIACPENMTVYTENGNSYYVVPDFYANGDIEMESICGEQNNIEYSQYPIPGTLLNLGEYTISFITTYSNGNSAICDTNLLIETSLSNEEYENKASINIYPNPSSSYFKIKAQPNRFPLTLKLFDLKGKKIKEINLNNYKNEQPIYISELSSGTYIIKISTRDNDIIKKLIKN